MKYVNEHVRPSIVSMAEAAGHKVAFSLPHHSDLLPIKLVWANVKGTVGQQYITGTMIKTVLTHLKKAIDKLDTNTV